MQNLNKKNIRKKNTNQSDRTLTVKEIEKPFLTTIWLVLRLIEADQSVLKLLITKSHSETLDFKVDLTTFFMLLKFPFRSHTVVKIGCYLHVERERKI